MESIQHPPKPKTRKRVVVTGGNGFVGTWLVRLPLPKSYTFHVTHHPSFASSPPTSSTPPPSPVPRPEASTARSTWRPRAFRKTRGTLTAGVHGRGGGAGDDERPGGGEVVWGPQGGPDVIDLRRWCPNPGSGGWSTRAAGPLLITANDKRSDFFFFFWLKFLLNRVHADANFLELFLILIFRLD